MKYFMQMQSSSESSQIRVIVLINAKEGKKQELLDLSSSPC